MKKSNFKVAIVDDEPNARGMIRALIQDMFPEMQIICETGKLNQAYQKIIEHEPDIIFLDVEMPDGSGFELLHTLPKRPAAVVFVSAYEKYAIKAIKASATDYLLKPVNTFEFKETVNKIISGMVKMEDQSTSGSVNSFPEVRKIAIPNLHGLNFIDVDDILYCEADGNYTMVYFKTDKKMVSRTLSQFESELSAFSFLRVHHKYLVNLKSISTYIKGKGGGHISLTNNAIIPVSVRKKNQLFRLFN